MKKKDSIKACGRTINYEIVYNRKRKKATVVVRPDMGIELRVPWGLKLETVRQMVEDKSVWICQKLDWFEKNSLPEVKKQYFEGEKFLYLGKEYHLRILTLDNVKKPYVSPGSSELMVVLPKDAPEETHSAQAKKAVWNFYIEQTMEKVEKFLKFYSKKMGITPPIFKVKYQKRRWGSCSTNNVIRINFQLLMAPSEQLEYVTVHELCHIKEKNHSAKFWKLVGELMPGYEIQRKALKKEGWKYVL
jgi:predicted metal-dependent hydrolase